MLRLMTKHKQDLSVVSLDNCNKNVYNNKKVLKLHSVIQTRLFFILIIVLSIILMLFAIILFPVFFVQTTLRLRVCVSVVHWL